MKGRSDSIDIYVGTRLKAARKALKLSQGDIAQALQVTFQQVQKYENGTVRMSASTLFRVSHALGKEVAYFFEGLAKPGRREK